MKGFALGFDLSLRAPAAVALPLDWRPGDWKKVRAWLGRPLESKSADLLKVGLGRYLWIFEWSSTIVRDLFGRGRLVRPGAELVAFVEDYGYHQNQGAGRRLAELGGTVKSLLYDRHGIVLTPVSSSEARKLVFGFSPRRPKYDAKVFVQDTLHNTFGAPKTWDENQCDAFVIAQAALSSAGGKILTLGGEPASKGELSKKHLSKKRA